MVELPAFRVVLQARTTSTRLPSKVLLPVGGMTLSVLAAKRAANSGADVVVAIPETAEDDHLARNLAAAGLKMVRGPLEDVLSRFLLATQDLEDSAICVRLTCDNPCPDGDFIVQIVTNFAASGTRYLAYGNDGQWLPYGLSAEVFRVGDLRHAAASHGQDHYVREHVTPSIRAAHADAGRAPLQGMPDDLGHLRCTVDTLEDYLRIVEIFANVPDPVSIPWRDLVARLQANRPPPRANLVLGTVQLGLPYGLRKEARLMAETEARAILQAADELGCTLDTARAYGSSEARIGKHLGSRTGARPIVTKLAPDIADATEAEASVMASLKALDRPRLDTLLLHRAEHITAGGGRIWQKLRNLQDEGFIGKLGVSVQTPQELQTVLARTDVQHVQLPFNLLDWRWWADVASLRSRDDITVHVRSVFLQGLLSQDTQESWPNIAGVDAQGILARLDGLVQELARSSRADLCIAYVRAFGWIDGLVMGVDSATQLHELAELFANPPLTWTEVCTVQESLPQAPQQLLNPALWPTARARTVATSVTAPPPKVTVSEHFTILRDERVMTSFPSLLATEKGLLLSVRLAPREPHDFSQGIGHQQHLHPRSAVGFARLDSEFKAGPVSLFPADLFAADQDPNLTRLPNGDIMISSFTWRPQAFGDAPREDPGFFTEKASNVTAQFWGSYSAISRDEGHTWGPRQYLPSLPGFPDLVPSCRVWHGGRHRGQTCVTRDGRLLIGTYDRPDNSAPFRCFLYESRDGAQTWHYAGPLTQTDDTSVGFAEPTLYRLTTGQLIALHRTFGAQGHLAVTRSDDDGHSWSAPDLVEGIIGHPFHVLNLNVDWAIVLYALRAQVSSIRAHLMNRHSGAFEGSDILLRNGAKSQDIGYPSGITLPCGRLLVCYYWVDDSGTRHIEGVILSPSI